MNPIDPPTALDTGQAAAAQPSFIIVTQVKAHRVVYFTDDPQYEPPMDGDWYYISHHTGALPEGMSLRNCWRWRFNGGVFTDAKAPRQKTAVELLVDNNRKALLQILRKKMNALREPLLAKGTLGAVVRTRKLAQAQAYLKQADTPADMALLRGVALARDITMLEAAQLVTGKAAMTSKVLEETEIVWERLAQAIRNAKTESELLELRAHLLDEVHPELSAKFTYKLAHTRPIDPDSPLGPVHRTHETARLKAQLRERINLARADADARYLRNDVVSSRTLELARACLAHDGQPLDDADFPLLQSRADLLGLSLKDAAQTLVDANARAQRLLVRTEQDKNRMLARINTIQTLRDVKDISQSIKDLNWTDQ